MCFSTISFDFLDAPCAIRTLTGVQIPISHANLFLRAEGTQVQDLYSIVFEHHALRLEMRSKTNYENPLSNKPSHREPNTHEGRGNREHQHIAKLQDDQKYDRIPSDEPPWASVSNSLPASMTISK